jgi:hypothetical protein
MNTQTKAVPVRDLSATARKLGKAASLAMTNNENKQIAFYAQLHKDAVLPSQLAEYRPDFRLCALGGFPAKVSACIDSKLFRTTDIIKVKTTKKGLYLMKREWQNQVNKRTTRLMDGYKIYLRDHAHVEERATGLVAIDPSMQSEKGAGVKKRPLAVITVDRSFSLQAAWSNIESPTTVEIEIAKLFTKILNLAKGMNSEAKALFNKKATGKK